MNARSSLLNALAVAGAIACGASQTSAPPTPSATPPSTAPPAPSGARFVTTPCVLSNGSSKLESRHAKGDASTTTTFSCDFGADCIAHPGGPSTPGDGFVGVTCEQTSCVCNYWRETTLNPPIREPFSRDASPGDGDTCRHLLLDRCMVGMTLYSGDAGAGADAR